jgi:ribosomal protein S2
MKKLPDAILVSDGIYERQALREAQILNIKSFAIFNTNGDIDLAYNIIPANTNSVKSYSYLVSELKSAFASKSPTSGKAVVKKMEEKKPVVKKIEEKKSTSKKSSSKTEEKSNKVEDRNVKVEEKVEKTKRTRSKKEEVKKEETA